MMIELRSQPPEVISSGNPAREAFDGDEVGALLRVLRKDHQPARRHRARILALEVRAAAILVHLDRSAAAIEVDRVPHDHDEIADVILDAERRQLAVVGGRFGEDDAGHLQAPERVHELEEMIAELVGGRPRAEERGGRVDDDRLDVPVLHGGLEAMDQSVEIVLAADDGRPFHRTREIGDVELAVAAQRREVEAEPVAGDEQILAALLDADEERRHVVPRQVRRELQREDRLAGAAAPGDERRPPLGDAAVRQDVKARNAGGELRNAHASVRLRRIRAAPRAAPDVKDLRGSTTAAPARACTAWA
jgi:hypothetical protein